MTQQYFTLDQANELIAKIRSAFEKIQQKKESHHKRHDELFLHELLTKAEQSSGVRPDLCGLESDIHGLEASVLELKKEIQTLTQLGCVIRSQDLSCVDFPTLVDGKPAFFCWRLGESQIRHYHVRAEGRSERLPILDK